MEKSTTQTGMRALLTDPCFELMPFSGFDEALQGLPDGARVAVTASPQLGIEATIEATVKASRCGHRAVPHLAARYVRDEAHLDAIAARLTKAGVTDLFVPAGDMEHPVGDFTSAHDLLTALQRRGHAFEEIGITGYPEGHPFLDEETLGRSMKAKAPYATYIVTQLCFNAATIIDWIQHIRDRREINLAVDVGIPGVLQVRRLLRIAQKIGVGNSIQFLRKTTGLLEFGRQLFGSWTQFSPDALIEELAPHAESPAFNLRGLHIYTFNQVADTEAWRAERLQTERAP